MGKKDKSKKKPEEEIKFEHSVLIEDKENLNVQAAPPHFQPKQEGEIVETFGPKGSKLHKDVVLPTLPVVEPICTLCSCQFVQPYSDYMYHTT